MHTKNYTTSRNSIHGLRGTTFGTTPKTTITLSACCALLFEMSRSNPSWAHEKIARYRLAQP
jgi:hypothetical protein